MFDWLSKNDKKIFNEILDKCSKKIEITKVEQDFLIDVYYQESRKRKG